MNKGLTNMFDITNEKTFAKQVSTLLTNTSILG